MNVHLRGPPMSPLVPFLRRFFARHPLLRDAILWAIPALLFGAVLRLLLLSYSPYALWGSDSRSYFGFTDGVLNHFYFSLNEKRRYLYPIFLLPVSLLPGATLRAIAWLQPLLGLLTILPFAYIVRRIFVGWKALIIPLTVLYAGLPVFIWYEHELIADTILFSGMVWMLAGWMAWAGEARVERARALWWWFFAPLAIIALTKPSVKFFWPGILFALVVAKAWRVLNWKQWSALAAVFLIGFSMGDDDQGSWLLYNTAFPFTQLETPLHAEYKAEIKDWVLAKRARIDAYAEEDYEVQKYLRGPDKDKSRPAWVELAKDKNKMARVYRDLALEAIKARPDLFVTIGLHRLLGSCNPADLDDDRFEADYFAGRLQEDLKGHRTTESMLRIAFGIPGKAPFPSIAQFWQWTCPHPDSAASPLAVVLREDLSAARRARGAADRRETFVRPIPSHPARLVAAARDDGGVHSAFSAHGWRMGDWHDGSPHGHVSRRHRACPLLRADVADRSAGAGGSDRLAGANFVRPIPKN